MAESPPFQGGLRGIKPKNGSSTEICVHGSLEKGGKLLKVPLIKGDLGGSNPKFRSLAKICVHRSLERGEPTGTCS
jgi:hypothetical protein